MDIDPARTFALPGFVDITWLRSDDFGNVFRARAVADGRVVGIRVVTVGLEAGARERLAQHWEAAVRRIPDANVVSVLSHGWSEMGPYVVTEDVSGETLRDRMRARPLDAEEVSGIGHQVADGLAALHRAGIFHGAVTPDVIVTVGSGWKLADDGLAEILCPLPPPAVETPVRAVLAYVAPEVLDGSGCSTRADLFSVAVALSEAAAGEHARYFSYSGSIIDLRKRQLHLVEVVSGILPAAVRAPAAAGLQPIPALRPADAAEFKRRLAEAHEPRTPKELHADVLDDDVQFTVYRPHHVKPEHWYTLLAFAHKTEPFVDEDDGPVDPLTEVREQARRRLGEKAAKYTPADAESTQAIARGSELTFVPFMEGVEFNPTRRSFFWEEGVHQEDFRLRASSSLNGQRARGHMSVYFGSLLIAEVGFSLRVDVSQVDEGDEYSTASPYRKIFASYSHKDLPIVEQVEKFMTVVGDHFIRDWTDLRSGEVWDDRLSQMIQEADVFQLFWSSNSMASSFVQQEWRYALSLNRANFIRPVYWEDPMPTREDAQLPPPELARLHFARLEAAAFRALAYGNENERAVASGVLDSLAARASDTEEVPVTVAQTAEPLPVQAAQPGDPPEPSDSEPAPYAPPRSKPPPNKGRRAAGLVSSAAVLIFVLILLLASRRHQHTETSEAPIYRTTVPSASSTPANAGPQTTSSSGAQSTSTSGSSGLGTRPGVTTYGGANAAPTAPPTTHPDATGSAGRPAPTGTPTTSAPRPGPSTPAPETPTPTEPAHPPGPGPAPSLRVTAAIAQTTATVSWSQIAGGGSDEATTIEVIVDGRVEFTQPVPLGSTSYPISGLRPDVSYVFRVVTPTSHGSSIPVRAPVDPPLQVPAGP